MGLSFFEASAGLEFISFIVFSIVFSSVEAIVGEGDDPPGILTLETPESQMSARTETS